MTSELGGIHIGRFRFVHVKLDVRYLLSFGDFGSNFESTMALLYFLAKFTSANRDGFALISSRLALCSIWRNLSDKLDCESWLNDDADADNADVEGLNFSAPNALARNTRQREATPPTFPGRNRQKASREQ